MAIYTIMFGISIFLIALVIAVIQKMFFYWKQEHKIERLSTTTNTIARPAVSIMIYADKCVMKCRQYANELAVYDVVSKSDISINKPEQSENLITQQ